MKKLSVLMFLLLILGAFLRFVQVTQADVSYHYRYQILTQGKSYAPGQELEIKLYINAQNEQVTQGNVIVNYDANALQLKEVKKWEIFEISVDNAEAGVIKINGNTQTQFSGEAPIAYLYFTTRTQITDLTQVLTATAGTELFPSPTVNNEEGVPTVSINSTIAPVSPTPTTIEPSPVPTSAINIPNCPNIEGNGPFTIVIIPDHYNNLQEFATDARLAVESIKRTNLPTSGLAKFTYRYSSDLTKDYQIYVDQVNSDLDMSLARNTQQGCQGDAFIIISKKYATTADSFRAGGFSTIQGHMAVIFRHSLFVTPHELGHALPGLFDEYSFGVEATIPAAYYNCSDTDQARCQEWLQKYPNDSQIGCYRVCGFTNWYRSTEYSTMNNDPDYINSFNPPSLEMWQVFFANY